MNFEPKKYERLLGLDGFSDALMNNHFTLYQAYVTNVNKLLTLIEQLRDSKKTSSPEYAEAKRRLGWEYNGMRLHELFFENMTKETSPITADSPLEASLTQDFKSFAVWKDDFIATGMIRGIGWAALIYDPFTRRCLNTWVNEHDVGHIAGSIPLITMDVFEHAYMLDYGLKRADYIEAFLRSIDWRVVEARLLRAQR